jgi:hypothetical protein
VRKRLLRLGKVLEPRGKGKPGTGSRYQEKAKEDYVCCNVNITNKHLFNSHTTFPEIGIVAFLYIK